MFLSAGCSFLRTEGFSCSLNVLHGGQGISKLQFLIKKCEIFFICKFVYNFWSWNFWIRIGGIHHKLLDPESMNLDPKHGFLFELMFRGDACGRGKAARARAGRRTVGPGAASQTLSKLCQVFQFREKKASLQVSLSESFFATNHWLSSEFVPFLTDPGHLSSNKVPKSVKTIKKAWKINRSWKQSRILTGLITLSLVYDTWLFAH